MALLEDLRAASPRLQSASDEQLLNVLAQQPEYQGLTENELKAVAYGQDGAPEESEPGFGAGVAAGVDQLQAMGGGLLMAAGEKAGSEDAYEAGKGIYDRNMEEAQENALGYGFTDLFSDPDTSAWQWAKYTAGNLLPTMATAVAGGGVGGVGVRMLAGTTAKRAATQAGQALGAYGTSAGMETGAIMGEIDDADVALAHGSVAGALDALPVMRALRKVGGNELADRAASDIADQTLGSLQRAASRTTKGAVGRGALTQALAESSTEGLQTLIEQHASHWVDSNGESLLTNLGEANWKEVADAAAAGALGGGVMGAPVGAVERGQARRALESRQRQERQQARKDEAISAAQQQAAANGGDPLQQATAGLRAEQAADAANNQEDAAAREAEAGISEAEERLARELEQLAALRGDAQQSTQATVRLRNAESILRRAQRAQAEGNEAQASRLFTRAQTIRRSLAEGLGRPGSPERPIQAEGEIADPDMPAGLLASDGAARLNAPEDAIYAEGPTADTTDYEPQARNVRRDERMQAQRQGAERMRANVAGQRPQIPDQGIVYGEGPVAGNANTGMDQPVQNPRFTDTGARGNADQIVDPETEVQPQPAEEAVQQNAPEVRLMRSGRPFPTERSAQASGAYLSAQRRGEQPEAVPVEGGFAVRVSKPIPSQDPSRSRVLAGQDNRSTEASGIQSDGQQRNQKPGNQPKFLPREALLDYFERQGEQNKDLPYSDFEEAGRESEAIIEAFVEHFREQPEAGPETIRKQAGVKDKELSEAYEEGRKGEDQNRVPVADPGQSLRGQPIDEQWTAFSQDSGTRNVPRSEMPQVKAANRGALANFLKARGIEGAESTVPAASLKPTQAEFSEQKVQIARERQGDGDRAILVSSDGHVLDGHHQWMAERDAGGDVRVIQLDAPIDTLLNEIKEFPSVEQDSASSQSTTPTASGNAARTTTPGADERYRLDEPNEQGVTAEAVRSAMAGMERELGDVTVVDRAKDLPENLIIGMALRGTNPQQVRGVYDGDQLYVIAGNNESIEEAVRTAVHEAVGHKGIRAVLGEDLDSVMRQLYKTLPLSKKGREALNEVLESYSFLDRNNADDQVTIGEEMVAHLLEKGYRPKAWQRAVAKIRELLRRKFPGIGWSYTDVLVLGEKSRDYLRWQQDGASGESVQRYSLRAQPRTTSEAFDDLTGAQTSALNKIAPRTPKESALAWFKEHTDRLGTKIRQGLVDRYAALKEMDEQLLGEDSVDGSTASSSWVLARMSSAASGSLTAMLNYGRIYMDPDQKVIDVRDDDSMGLGSVLGRLGDAAEIERFMGWIAGNRSARLAAEGRENLFEASEIEGLRTLNQGTTQDGRDRGALYDEVFAEFQKYRDDVLAIAEQSGIISAENRAMWRDEFYTPFYRISEEAEGPDAPRATSGLTRAEAYKKLKGGSGNLNDLLQNTMMNFAHLLQTSLKNQAAMQAMDNAEAMGIANQAPESQVRGNPDATYVLRDGQKVWYEVSDPLVYKAISSLAHPGMNNTAMKMMRGFKRVFTNMTTTTPQFVVANMLRDSMQAAATSPLSKNIPANLFKGARTYADKRTRARMMASGGSFSFGHLYGENADELKVQLTSQMRRAHLVSDPSQVPAATKLLWRKWNDATDFTENMSRAEIYRQNEARGKLFAAFQARDLMDFSSHGAWPAVRFLIDVVPFMNARLQGLDKIGRSGVAPALRVAMGKGSASDKEAAARFWTVTGSIAMATVALYLHNYDDEEYRKLEDWQKDSYWFFRIGDQGIFIPKPFEVGAIATLVERMTEQMVDDKATGELFRERLSHMLTDTFSFSPVPQIAQPMLDVYSNYDAFTGRPIESMGMDRLSPSLRARSSTTAPAHWISEASEKLFGPEGKLTVSPVQVDHLIQGYLGQVGAWGAGITDTVARTMQGETKPANHWYEYQPIRRFYQNLGDEDRYNRYGTLFYEGLNEVGRVYADIKEYRELGEQQQAMQLLNDNREMLRMRKWLNRTQSKLSTVNKRMQMVQRSDNSAEFKRREMDRLRAMKNRLTEIAGRRLESVKAGE